MFFARWELGGPWSSTGIDGTARWLRRVWAIYQEKPSGAKVAPDVIRGLRRKLHQTLRSITRDFEQFEFNTIISGLMELMNEMYKAAQAGAVGTPEWQETLEIYALMLAPVCPHLAEELWMKMGKSYSIHNQPFPAVDEAAAAEDEITLVVQVNGKLRDRINAAVDITEDQVKALALSSPQVQKAMDGKQPRQVIVVPGRLVNIVV